MSEVSALSFEAARPARNDVGRLSGFLVVDLRGRVVGRVGKPWFGSTRQSPRGLIVRYGFLGLRHCLVAPDLIEQIDGGAKVIGLRSGRKALRAGRA
jgi:hypothetical protein